MKGIQRAFADSREYYLLAYSPTNKAADGTFRKIEIKTGNKEWKVQARKGYYAIRTDN